MFAHAMRRTSVTAPKSSHSVAPTLPTSSVSGATANVRSLFESGYCAARWLAMTPSSVRACASVAPGRSRAITPIGCGPRRCRIGSVFCPSGVKTSTSAPTSISKRGGMTPTMV